MSQTRSLPIYSIVLIVVFLAGGVSTYAQQLPSSDPKPTLSVVVDQEIVQWGDSIPVILWIANTSNQPLYDVHIEIYGPATMQWSDGKHQHSLPAATMPFERIEPNKIFEPKNHAIHIANDAKLGLSTLLFVCRYRLNSNGETHESLVMVERTLNVEPFGIGNIAGVPIAFARFIIPGFILLLVLTPFNIQSIKELNTENRLIVGILFSVACQVFYGLVEPFLRSLSRAFPATTGITDLDALIVQCISGAIIGGFIGAAALIIRQKATANTLPRLLVSQSRLGIILKKALKLSPRYTGKPTVITLMDGNQYIGAHSVEIESDVYLFGSFLVLMDHLTPKERKALCKLGLGADKVIDEEWMRHAKNVIAVVNTVRPECIALNSPVVHDGNPVVFTNMYQRIRKDDIRNSDSLNESPITMPMPLLRLF